MTAVAERAPALPAVLRDPVADHHLRTSGYAVVDLPEAVDVAAALLDAYGDLHGWAGANFEPDLVNPDTDYRRSVSARISESLDAATLGLYRDATPFLRNFLCKWPGPESDLYLHRDWMYIDEETSGARTHVTWVPLVDVTLENGPLQVLPGSHRFDPSRRGTHLNGPWIQQRDVIVPRLVTVTARLGQAVVMDNALVHSSLPNRSDQPRLVAAVGMRPQGQPLVHYLHTATDDALRYDVDDEFFLRITPQALMAEPPDLPVAATVSGAQLTIGPDDLGTALDAVRPADPAESATRGRWWTRRLRRPGR